MTAVSFLISSWISRNGMTNGSVLVAKPRLFMDSKVWAMFQRAWHALMHVTVTGKYVVQNTTQSIPVLAAHTTCINTWGWCMRFPGRVFVCVGGSWRGLACICRQYLSLSPDPSPSLLGWMGVHGLVHSSNSLSSLCICS